MRKTAIYIVLIIAALIFFIYYFTNIFTYLVLSLVLAAILRPLVEKISGATFYGIQIPRWLAILIAFGAMIGLITVFVILFIPLIDDQISLLSSLDIDEVTESILDPIRSFESFLIEKNLSDEAPGFLVKDLQDVITDAISKVQVQSILTVILSFLSSFFVGLLALKLYYLFIALRKRPFAQQHHYYDSQ